MDPPAQFEKDCPYCTAGLDLGTHQSHGGSVNPLPPDSRCSNPLDLAIDLNHISRYKDPYNPGVPQEKQFQLYPIALPARLSRSRLSSFSGFVQSSSSAVHYNASGMIEPTFLELAHSAAENEPLEDWCERAQRLAELQHEADQLRKEAAPKPEYDPQSDPELSVPAGDQSTDSDAAGKRSASPESQMAYRSNRRTAKRSRIALACDVCRDRKVKPSRGITAKDKPKRKYKQRQTTSSPSSSSPSSSEASDSHSSVLTFNTTGVELARPGEQWVHAPSPPRYEDMQDYRFGTSNDDDHETSTGSEDSLGLNEVFESALGLTGVYSRRPSTITVPSPPPSPGVLTDPVPKSPYALSPISATDAPSPLVSMHLRNITSLAPGDTLAAQLAGQQRDGRGLLGSTVAHNIGETLAPGGRVKGRHHATYIPLPDLD
ncbi:hypothetical protein HWV62_26236 [Athelia sp. TMB]|nr:hypothetical protein HWV62_26236 [Athelia sp. TMB]